MIAGLVVVSVISHGHTAFFPFLFVVTGKGLVTFCAQILGSVGC